MDQMETRFTFVGCVRAKSVRFLSCLPQEVQIPVEQWEVQEVEGGRGHVGVDGTPLRK